MDSNNQQTNTWSGGMNTDTSDALINSNQYRFARNLRYVTEKEQNTGELHLIPGAKLIKQISNESNTDDTYILETTSLRDKAIFITTYSTTGWAVWTIDNWRKGSDVPNPRCVFSTTDSSRVLGCKISLVTKYEDFYNQKLYIADGKGPVLMIQINPKDGKELLDLEDVTQISAYPSVSFEKPVFLGYIPGSLQSGVVQYSYQFYNKHGQQSEISPSTKLIPISRYYKDGALGYLETDQTNVGISISISINSDVSFEKIRVFRILYHINGQLPIIESIYDDDVIKGGTITVDDIGQSGLETLSVEEYNSITGIHIIPKTIESKDDYLFAGNIKDYSEEFDKQLSNLKFNAGFGCETLNLNSPYQPKYDEDGDIGGSGDIISWKFVVTELIGDVNKSNNYIEFPSETSFGNQPQNQVYDLYTIKSNGFSNQNSDMYIELQSSDTNKSYINPVVSSELKSLRRDEIYRYGIVLYNKLGQSSSVKWICDIRTPDIKHCPTFNIPPYAESEGGFYDGATLAADTFYPVVLYPLGIRFTVDTSKLPESVVAYEIVRSKREYSDIATITQGALSRTIRVEYDRGGSIANNPFTPTGLITHAEYEARRSVNDPDSNKYTARTSVIGPYQFICPECVYTKDTINVIQNRKDLKLSPVNYIYPSVGNTIAIDTIYSSLYDLTIEYLTNIGNNFANVGILNHRLVYDLNERSSLLWFYYNASDTIDSYDKAVDRWQNDNGEVRYSYIKLYGQDASIIENLSEKNIKDLQIAEGLQYNDFADTSESHNLKFKEKTQAIGQNTYINWVTGTAYNMVFSEYADHNGRIDQQLQGPAGSCILIDTSYTYDIALPEDSINKAKEIGTLLCNIRKSTVPYGGTSTASVKLQNYRSFGDYANVNTGTINVFDGDTYIMPFEYCSLHKFIHPDITQPVNACIMYSIPVETSINLAYTSGFEFSKEYKTASGNISYIQEQPANVNNMFVQDTPQYVYNTVYSVSDSPKIFTADDEEYDEMNQDYRVYNSLLKTSNEQIDNWLKFQPANYIDVDSRLGQITGLRRFKNKLIFWQDDATGLLSVNERSIITDHNKMPLVLGSGDVLARHDYITTSNGMKVDQYADAQSESTLYWWDYVRKELCSYQDGQGYGILSKSKFVQNYINTGNNIDDPKLIFDKQYNELISNIVNNESLIYNELTNNFISIYNIHPAYYVQLSDKLLIADRLSNNIFQWNIADKNEAFNTESDTINNKLFPYLEYTVNKGADTTKVFDNGEIAGRFYGGNHNDIDKIKMQFDTPLKQHSSTTGKYMSNIEYNFRYAIPRDGESELGNRMRGKFMRASVSSDSNSLDFSIQYITTKFRISWG